MTVIQFIENTIASLHASWYTMLFFTVLPMVVSVPRQLSLVYLAVYAISGACVVQFGLPELLQRGEAGKKKKDSGCFNNNNNSGSLHSKMKTVDDKTRNNIFRLIKLQDP
jgi:hypothetical protein